MGVDTKKEPENLDRTKISGRERIMKRRSVFAG